MDRGSTGRCAGYPGAKWQHAGHHAAVPTNTPHVLITEHLPPFLRGETSVTDLTAGVNAAVRQIAQTRPLCGAEVDLFMLLERWEVAGWVERPAVVDDLRNLTKSMLAMPK
ncbi:hypothetical protein [Phytohabitans aurantiacus]|uniref:Uncharacterized protein n=1 Tax=Phytohabitans aurantiacus TaxID=3016789 RepID=A0ABQ5R6F3_9ACTN|nr:hypothetical protein [Phytohabitans aurantiacus]GLI02280.1 hypothetical protein Pa4123_75580 [Phytohabitans aurantiacus]